MKGVLGAEGASVGPVLIGRDLFTVALLGSGFTGTVTLWRASGRLASPAAGDYRAVKTFTADTEYTGSNGSSNFYKLTIETGDYTAGSMTAWIEE